MPIPLLSRRRFAQIAAGTTLLSLLDLPRVQASLPTGPGLEADRVRVAVIGLRIKGHQHAEMITSLKGARLVALCDADSAILAENAAKFSAAGHPVDTYVDFRRLLDRKDIDAVIIATPNHWHTLQTLMALQAGKDVYVEKPISHTLEESVALAQAAKTTQRIVQAGTQRRSDPGLNEALAALHAGELGKVKQVRGFCYRLRPSIGWTDQPAPVPPSVDLDLYCGPAALEVPVRKRFHYDWHWSWEMGNGEIGNQGPHELDICRRIVGASGRPQRVLSLGGRFGEKDTGQTPNTHLTWFDFEEAPVLFEVRGLPRQRGSDAEDSYKGLRVGVVADCEGGFLTVGNAGANFLDLAGKRLRRFEGDGGMGHLQNFIDAVRARDSQLLQAPLAESVPSADLVHFGNLAYRTGQVRRPEEIHEELKASPAAAEAFASLALHTQQYNLNSDAPLEWRLGGWLEWDKAQHRFTSLGQGIAANALFGRKYRAPWTLPV